jgi:hypothetical protein
MISPRQARQAKAATISDNLLNNALAMTHQPIQRCQVTPGYVEMYVPCGSGKHGFHVVTESGGYVICDCEARGICKHVLSSVGRPALHCIQQLRWARDIADLDDAFDFYAPAIREIPDSLKNLVRLEIHRQRERIYRSGAMNQSLAQAA